MGKAALIMAGGSGERFWPLSRKNHPKQFLKLFSKDTLIRESFNRVASFIDLDKIFVVTLSKHKDKIKKAIPELKEENIITEPCSRDTAAAIGLGVIYIITKLSEDATILVCASDHIIKNINAFKDNAQMALVEAAKQNKIITLGIKPNRVETNYGYIELQENFILSNNLHKVLSFKEKPEYQLAKKFTSKGNFLWNSGMFIFKASVLLSALNSHMKELSRGLDLIKSAVLSNDYEDVKKSVYSTLPKQSIDFGVMEDIKDILCIVGDFEWDDVGSWDAYERHFKKDYNNNIAQSSKKSNGDNGDNGNKGKIILENTNNSLIINNSKQLLCTMGLSNLTIINTEDAILIFDKNHTKHTNIKKLLSRIKDSNLEDYL